MHTVCVRDNHPPIFIVAKVLYYIETCNCGLVVEVVILSMRPFCLGQHSMIGTKIVNTSLLPEAVSRRFIAVVANMPWYSIPVYQHLLL